MRALLFALLLLSASGCRKNHDLFVARLAELELRIAEAQETADKLNEDRKAIALLELKVKTGLDDVPEAKAAVARLDDEPLVLATGPGPLPPLPPESVFEGSGGPHLRMRISDSEQRLAQLSKVLGEVERIRAESRRMKQKLEVIDRLRAERK